MTGDLVGVQPGDKISATIEYDASSGVIKAVIRAPGGESRIDIPRPFPNEPSLFSSWKDFFEKAARKTGTPLVNAVGDIETGVNAETICTLVPWVITDIQIPTVEMKASDFKVSGYGSFSCEKPLVHFRF
jgi:hypothetical protein